ncbi:MAG: oligosaccharide flippase family protein, partial [Deltaproteobacteria bacterium]|nr:oligosaccharide flippase family protein [Deltaproteobacteria bacterium]
MSIAQKAARGALWTVISSMGGRVIGVFGTLIMTRFMKPEIIGEVSDASILAMTASWISSVGFGPYAVVKGRGPDADEVTWHAVVFHLLLGTIAIGAIAAFGGRLMPLLDAPHAAAYVPGMALSVWIRRWGTIPERILTRQMKFRASGMAQIAGEIAYTGSALTLAAIGFCAATSPGQAIVVANIVQSTAMVVILIRASGLRDWTTRTPLRWARITDMVKFGLPIMIQGVAHAASRSWDNLLISRYFGTATLGTYNMAYNLADIPAIQVGEQLALVLMPSMAELPPERRPAAFERSSALLSLIIFPLAVGLGLVAYPLIALILPANNWQDVAPLLVVLACLSIFRPITWVVSAYMEASSKTGRLMWIEIGKTIAILVGITMLARYGVRAAAAAVGLAFGLMAIAGVAMVLREGPSPSRLLLGFLRPLLACGVMGVATWGTEQGLVKVGYDHPALLLFAEIIVGAVAYVIAAFAIAPKT